MRENQDTITEWALGTFGLPTALRLAERLYEAVRELEDVVDAYFEPAISSWALEVRRQRALSECADCLIVLYQLADALGGTLEDEVNAKMTTNRKRRWQLNGDGTAQHVKEPEQLNLPEVF